MWFRRDLRLEDNAALFQALRSARRVFTAFVFDRAILDELLAEGLHNDRRVDFIHRSLTELDARLRERGGALIVRHGVAAEEIPRLAAELRVDAVFANHDYEPYAIDRDAQVDRALHADGRKLHTFKDQVIFERGEVLTAAGKPFSVFTPYRNAWLKRLAPADLHAQPTEKHSEALAAPAFPCAIPDLPQIGFARSDLDQLKVPTGGSGARLLFDDFGARIDAYRDTRDFPSLRGPSYLSVHLRFGTISIRQLVRFAHEKSADSPGAASWLSELIWREFYQQILFHHPRAATESFKPQYDRIRWDNDRQLFATWCNGHTGYPLIDAAMTQINQTGYMHNRLRMVTASFLAKDLGVDWRWGERFFARRLLDFDLAANNGGWQWAASSGCDAQPYFRVFNPVTQSEKFDPEGRFIRRYLPQLAGFTAQEIHAPWRVSLARQKEAGCVIGRKYPPPCVEHAAARARTLLRYAVVHRP